MTHLKGIWMKKRIISLFAVIFVLFSFVSCNSEKEKSDPDRDIDIDVSKLSDDISKIYDDGEIELIEIDSAEAFDINYGLKGLYTFYYAEGSIAITSDEIVIIEANDKKDAKKVYEMLDSYREARIKLFNSYAKDQVPKLEDALLERVGKYVIFVVAEDVSEAEKIWREYTK